MSCGADIEAVIPTVTIDWNTTHSILQDKSGEAPSKAQPFSYAIIDGKPQPVCRTVLKGAGD